MSFDENDANTFSLIQPGESYLIWSGGSCVNHKNNYDIKSHEFDVI